MSNVNFMELLCEGQLMLGDVIVIIGKSKSDSQVCEVHNILDVNGKEEVVIHDEENKYFITSMYLNGESWVESVFIVS